MNIEKKSIEAWSTGEGSIGHISLDKLANPDSVKVTFLGKTLIPKSFNFLGHPNFTIEQEMLCQYKADEANRSAKERSQILAEITYEERPFDVPQVTFDSIAGIKKSLGSLETLQTMLQNRSIYTVANPKKRLDEFLIFGCFWLDQFGQVMSLQRDQVGTLDIRGDVEKFSDFKKHNSDKNYIFTTDGFDIPAAGSVCPCCGKAITLEDIKANPVIYRSGKFFHDTCRRELEKYQEIDKFVRSLVGIVYKDEDFTFDLLPNGYCHRECCSHIPWFMFHTIDGDIKIGMRKRVISIEWQPNYKPFDMEKLFGEEQSTKWIEGGRRGIHAWSRDDAFRFLRDVVEEINPGYSRW